MSRYHEILCAVDFSEAAHAALEAAAELARESGAALTLVHVREEPHGTAAARVLQSPSRLEAEAAALGHRLQAWRDEAERRAGRPVRTILRSGAPAEEIVRVARHDHPDVVVTGHRDARGKLDRLLGGSVAERVVRDAPCAVLVARPPEDRGD